MSTGTIVGLDIGYGQTKVVWSDHTSRGPNQGIYPSGAAPVALADRVGFGGDGEAGLAGGAVEVQVEGQRYAALVEPMSLRHGMSTLHANYTSTPEYTALYYGALTKVGSERIKHLVTGLPVSFFKDRDKVLEVKQRLSGRHEISRGRFVHVDMVSILPQGYGAWAWAVDHLPAGHTNEDVLLVIDFGHFSVDWICIVHNNFRLESSGSSIRGGSLVLDEVTRIIEARTKVKVGREVLFAAIRKAGQGPALVKAGRETIDINPLIREVSERSAPAVVGEIKASMRDQQMEVSRVMVCGGSAGFFIDAVREAFDKADIEPVHQTVLANAHGHRLYGVKFA